MATEDRSQTFDSLVSGLDGDERRALLTKMQNGSQTDTAPLETKEVSGDDDATIDFKTKILQEPLFTRIWLWIKSIFSSKSVELVYNESLVAQIARDVERQTPGLIDYKHKYLCNDFYEKLIELQRTAEFFSGCISSFEKDSGPFYVLLGSLLMPEVGESMDKEADPYQYALTKEANAEMRTSLLRKMDDILQKIPADQKSAMYSCVRSVEWLRQFTKLPFENFLAKFTAVIDDVHTCSFEQIDTELSAFVQILCNGRTIPEEVIEALYLFNRRQTDSPELDDADGIDSGASFMTTATAQLSVISMFISVVPLRALARVVYNNALFVPDIFGGGEDWYVKYKAEWKRLFDRKWETWIRDCKKEKLKSKLMDFFHISTFPVFPVRPWTSLWGGIPFRYEMTLGFLYNFFINSYPAYEKTLKVITLEGDFSIKDNRFEFNETTNLFSDVSEALLELATKLGANGEYGAEFARYQGMKTRTKSGMQKITQVIGAVEESVGGLIKSFGDACRTMDKLLSGITADKIDSRYGNLTNITTIQGHENKKFRDGIEETKLGFEHAFEIIKEIEPLDTPIAE